MLSLLKHEKVGIRRKQAYPYTKTSRFFIRGLQEGCTPLNPANSQRTNSQDIQMPKPPATDPLIPVPLRLPTSTVLMLRDQAEKANCGVSDVLRTYMTLEAAKPLGKPKPRQRQPKELAKPSGSDPLLLRQLSVIGNNVNQIARAMNTACITGERLQIVDVLTVLVLIEKQLDRIATPQIVLFDHRKIEQ